MTNNTQMLPCPFCGKSELSQFAIKAALDVAYVVNCKWCGGRAEAWTEEDAVAQWNTRAPAQDVSAVVDEPVVYQVKTYGMTLYWDKPSESPKAVNTPLYLHHQRSISNLKRYDWARDDGMVEDATGEYVLWSDLERLNK